MLARPLLRSLSLGHSRPHLLLLVHLRTCTPAGMSSVRHSSAEPAPDRPEKRPRLDDPEPAMHISIEPSAPVPVDSDAVDIDSGPADYARNPSPDSRLPARPAHGQAPENLSKRARAKAKRRKNRHLLPEPYTGEWIVAHEVDKLLGEDIIDQAVAESSEWDSPFQDKNSYVLEVTVSRLSSTGMSSVRQHPPLDTSSILLQSCTNLLDIPHI